MRIDQSPIGEKVALNGAGAASIQKPGTGSNATGGSAAGDADSVSLSGLASLISLSAQAGAADRSEHVNRIAAGYRSGSYTVDNAALSEALTNHAFED